MPKVSKTIDGAAVQKARCYSGGDGVAVLPSGSASVRTPAGRVLTVSQTPDGPPDTELLVIEGEGGAVELAIELTPRGPVLVIDAIGVKLTAAGRVDLACDTLSVRASEAIELVSGGDATLAANRDAKLVAGSTSVVRGRETEIDAVRGESRIIANDDVRLRGERVMLNCED